MTTQPTPSDDPHDPSLSAIMGERRQLINLAYRFLGSLADAEDVVQETYSNGQEESGRDRRLTCRRSGVVRLDAPAVARWDGK
jgi:hypothetical protein